MSKNIIDAIDNFSQNLKDQDVNSTNVVEAIDTLADVVANKIETQDQDLTWSQIVNDIQAGDFSRYAVGDILTCTYKGEDGTLYDNPLRIVDIREEELEDGTTRKGMWLQQKYATADAVQFSQKRALFYFEEGLAAGTYNFTLTGNFNNNYPANTVLSFTIENNVPECGKLALSSSELSTSKVLIYEEDGKMLLEEGSTLTKETAGTSLGNVAIKKRFGNTNSIYEALYGCNSFEISATRQWLNSDKKAGEWWTAQDKWDIAPSNLNGVDGYLSKLPTSLVASLRPVKIITVGNTPVYENEEFETFDLVILPSKEQMYCAKQKNNEGAVFSYWQELNGTNSTFTDYSGNEVIKIGSVNNPYTPCVFFLRSAYVNEPYAVWRVSGSGNVGDAGAAGRRSCLSTFFIC